MTVAHSNLTSDTVNAWSRELKVPVIRPSHTVTNLNLNFRALILDTEAWVQYRLKNYESLSPNRSSSDRQIIFKLTDYLKINKLSPNQQIIFKSMDYPQI